MLSTFSRLVFFLFVFLTSYFTSRQLSKSAFGEIQFIMLLVNIGWVLFNFGIPNILSRYFTQAVSHHSFKAIQKLLMISSITAGATLLISGLFLFGFLQAVEVGVHWGIMVLLVFSTIILFYVQILVQALFAYKAVFIINLIACSAALTFLLIQLPLIGPMAFLYTYIIVNGILSLGYTIVLIKGINKMKEKAESSQFELPHRNSLVKTAIYFGGSAILAGLLWQRYELSILKLTVPFDELAVYLIAFSVMALIVEPLKLIPSALIFYFASISHEG
jgi:O-antigen/teichoic acid export membrane protein